MTADLIATADQHLAKATLEDLPRIIELINQEHNAAGSAACTAIQHAVAAGRLLIRAEHFVKHGEWLPWLKSNFNGSARTAQKYMKLARYYHLLPPKAKAPSTAHLTIDKALGALAKPSRRVVHCAFRGADARRLSRDDRSVGPVDVRYAVRKIANRFLPALTLEVVRALRELADEIEREAKGGES